MRRGFRGIPARRRIFLGCEGESEQGYGALIQKLASDRQHPHIFIDAQVLNGGDPLGVVEAAIQREHNRASKHGVFEIRAILLDRDRIGQSPERDARIHPLAAQHEFLIIWQRPSHEALLLRHLPGCQTLQPPNSNAALVELRQRWPSYQKPMSRAGLAARIGLAEIRSAAAVEVELNFFLAGIGVL